MVVEGAVIRRRACAASVVVALAIGVQARGEAAPGAADRKGSAMQQAVTIVREDYLGWPNTYRIANGLIEARVATDIGPRIMDVRLTGGDNLLYVRESEAGGRGEPAWTFRGGWRLWIAPERKETTYALDNEPCTVEVGGGRLRVTGPPQPVAGIQKRLEVSLAPGEARLRLRPAIRNIADRPLTYAAWSLPVMRPGGRAFVPLDVGPLTAFDSIRRVILWSYTEFGDPRYGFGDRLIEIDQGRVPAPAERTGRRDDESKIGVDSGQGWVAYLLDRTLFLKRFAHEPGRQYPDGGATIEIYSSREFLELEHLGPLTTFAPGEEIELREDWWLVAGVDVPKGAAALDALLPHVKRAELGL